MAQRERSAGVRYEWFHPGSSPGRHARAEQAATREMFGRLHGDESNRRWPAGGGAGGTRMAGRPALPVLSCR
jgi:hypothetical protein